MKTMFLLAAAVLLLGNQQGPQRPRQQPRPASPCWQDYCPCEGPDYGGADPAICRMLRAGLRVSEEQLAAAAAARDARRQIRQFNAGAY